MPSKEKTIFLSFDDGPTPLVTQKVLEMLDTYQAKATFFLSGKNAAANQELVKIIRTKNHTVANHGWEHLNGWKTAAGHYVANAQKGAQTANSALFRPPHGRISPRQIIALKKSGYQIIMWSVITRDYENLPDLPKAANRVLSLINGGSIVLLHDTLKAEKNCLYLLRAILEQFSGKGYSFAAIPPLNIVPEKRITANN
jgi:peptidoglycan/xylan/chitin deacetylase (PgdA/CDA1 family)